MVERLLFLFFLFLPFQFALSPAEGVDLALSRVAALLIGLLFLGERFRTGSWQIPQPLALFAMAGFLGTAALSYFFAEEPSWTLRKFIFLLSFLPLWFACFDTLVRGGEKTARLLGLGFFLGAAVSAAVALMQFSSQFVFSLNKTLSFLLTYIHPIFLGETFSQSVATHPSLLVNIGGETILRAVGVFPDPHIAAFYFGMAIPFGLVLGLASQGKQRKLFFLGTALLFLADLCTFSRGGYVGLFVMPSLFGVFSLFHFRGKISGALLKKTMFGVAVVVLAMSVPPVRERVADTFSLKEGSNSARIALWKEAVERISARPLLGYGLGNYPLAVKPSANYREPIYIHNTYLDIWAEVGLIGLFFFLLVFLWPAGRFFFSETLSSPALPAALALALFLGHSLFENILFSVHIFPVLLFLSALLLPKKDVLE